jgi:cephalosporin hydroxylase
MHNAEEFLEWRNKQAIKIAGDLDHYSSGINWMNNAVRLDYSYMFEWLGVPVIQFPGDLLLIQEAIVSANVSKVIEVGIARGGTTIFIASILNMLGKKEQTNVIGVDLSISNHTKDAILNSPFANQIKLIEGDSVCESTFKKVSQEIQDSDRVLIILDSNHSMDHVYKEMLLYSELVSEHSYLIVMDTAIEFLEPSVIGDDKPWGKGDNPDTAIKKFMSLEGRWFELDQKFDHRSFPGAAKGGFLKRKSSRNQ